MFAINNIVTRRPPVRPPNGTRPASAPHGLLTTCREDSIWIICIPIDEKNKATNDRSARGMPLVFPTKN
jgi:hypothetical protein